MPDSPSAWLRSLAAEATTAPWKAECENDEHTILMLQEGETRGYYSPAHVIHWSHGLWPGEATDEMWGDGEQWAEADANARLIALAPSLAVLCADAIDTLERIYLGQPEDFRANSDAEWVFGMQHEARNALARFAALQPDNTEEEQT